MYSDMQVPFPNLYSKNSPIFKGGNIQPTGTQSSGPTDMSFTMFIPTLPKETKQKPFSTKISMLFTGGTIDLPAEDDGTTNYDEYTTVPDWSVNFGCWTEGMLSGINIQTPCHQHNQYKWLYNQRTSIWSQRRQNRL